MKELIWRKTHFYCERCGKAMIKKANNIKFCSIRCKNKEWNSRHRDYKHKKSLERSERNKGEGLEGFSRQELGYVCELGAKAIWRHRGFGVSDVAIDCPVDFIAMNLGSCSECIRIDATRARYNLNGTVIWPTSKVRNLENNLVDVICAVDVSCAENEFHCKVINLTREDLKTSPHY